MGSSQFRSKLRQLQQKQRQAVNKYNAGVRKINQQKKQAVDNLNREIRAYNARVRSSRQKLKTEIARLDRQPTPKRFVTYRTTVNAVQRSYERLEQAAETGPLDESYNEVLDLSEREAANNAGMMNALLGEAESPGDSPDKPESPVTSLLATFSKQWAACWRGALFALDPGNPEAARHFCTSAREIIAGFLDAEAPDDAVKAAMPDCERTPERGTPTRRAKIKYILHVKGYDNEALEDFVVSDMDSIVDLHKMFNKGTHGQTDSFNLAELSALRKRTEDGIEFLARISS